MGVLIEDIKAIYLCGREAHYFSRGHGFNNTAKTVDPANATKQEIYLQDHLDASFLKIRPMGEESAPPNLRSFFSRSDRLLPWRVEVSSFPQ